MFEDHAKRLLVNKARADHTSDANRLNLPRINVDISVSHSAASCSHTLIAVDSPTTMTLNPPLIPLQQACYIGLFQLSVVIALSVAVLDIQTALFSNPQEHHTDSENQRPERGVFSTRKDVRRPSGQTLDPTKISQSMTTSSLSLPAS